MQKFLGLLFLLVLPGATLAQGTGPEIIARRNVIEGAADAVQSRFGIAVSGGNPVPGASSTLGMRLGKLPRISVALRGTAATAEMLSIRDRDDTGEIDFLLTSLNLDAAVGVFSGFSPLPTVGGVGSIDLIASAGTLFIPDEGGFRNEAKKSWAVGTRIGILRESFTAPGIAVTGMYRRIGDIQFGSRDFTQTDAWFVLDDLSALSVRGTIGKKLLGFGALAGVGFDRYSSDLSYGFTTGIDTERINVLPRDFDNHRTTIFGNLSYTLLVLSLNGEIGWQSGADTNIPVPGGGSAENPGAAWYGSLALRLSI